MTQPTPDGNWTLFRPWCFVEQEPREKRLHDKHQYEKIVAYVIRLSLVYSDQGGGTVKAGIYIRKNIVPELLVTMLKTM